MMKSNAQLIVALDVEAWEEARTLVERLGETVSIYKVGSQLFTAYGPQTVRDLLKAGKKVFLDLKFHDIPNTVANAVSAAAKIMENGQGIFMCTLHTVGGKEMLQRAVNAAAKTAQSLKGARPLLVGITVLTSDGNGNNIPKIVLQRAMLAREAGLDGVVASSHEAAIIRQHLGNDFIVVTPGIRPEGSAEEDQKRVTTPAEAVRNGSNFLVVGRPIVKAPDPRAAAQDILDSIR